MEGNKIPIYEYRCDHCGNEFEVIGNFTMESAVCPFCEFVTLHKIMSALGRIEGFDPYLETDITDKPIYIRHKQDLKDAIAKYNDGEEASKTGKLAVYDTIKSNKVKYG